MHRSYLARHYFDGRRLRRKALAEFAAAMRSGRTVAFVGSGCTEQSRTPPYPEWHIFLKKYARKACELVEADPTSSTPAKEAIASAEKSLGGTNPEEALASLSVIEYALAYSSENGENKLEKLREFAAEEFFLKRRSISPNASAVVHGLGIDRIITLNYDLEFEWELMTTPREKMLYNSARSLKHLPVSEDYDTQSITRTLPSGRTVVSDIFIRERTDRLIEFAVGSPDQDHHILHLHGRITHAKAMIISQRDYNAQYRRSGVARLPFEHALRMLFSGNPILFIGVGMQERDVTATLEQFVSDHPNRRISPAFILWNAPARAEERDAIRFRWLHRFGVLTLFDDEVARRPPELAAEIRSLRLTGRKLLLWRLSRSIAELARKTENVLAPDRWDTADLRTIQRKLKGKRGRPPERVDIWHPLLQTATRHLSPAVLEGLLDPGHLITYGVAEPGSGKGGVAKAVRAEWHNRHPGGRSCIINASFVFETDSMFSLISGLDDNQTAFAQKLSRAAALEVYLASIEESLMAFLAGATPPARSPRQLLVIINGMERFFAPNGAPLSSELDALVRKVGHAAMGMLSIRAKAKETFEAKVKAAIAAGQTPPSPPAMPPSPLKIVLLGTGRVGRYLDALRPAIDPLMIEAAGFAKELTPPAGLRSVYFEALATAFRMANVRKATLQPSARGLIAQKRSADRSGARRAILAAYLTPEALKQAGVDNPDLCLSILTVMAFIGQPVEDAVLAHAPSVQDDLKGLVNRVDPTDHSNARAAFERAIADLVRLRLLIKVSTFEGSPPGWSRYGLHRSVLAELRDRHGVPLSDAQLSAAFNLSIFAAQPADGYSPEREIHQELGRLGDWFIGAYKDPPLGLEDALEDEGSQVWRTAAERAAIKKAAIRQDARRAWPHVSACLRAALSLMRSYYSTSALLTLDRSEQALDRDEDGPLTEHADRLQRLLQAAQANALERRRVVARLGSCADWVGPAPFYGDDLVWLQNEFGVVKLAQGDLYEARHAFEEALRLNREQVEFGDHGQNWRRITLNQVHVDIERGALDRAESRMDQIEKTISRSSGLPIASLREEVIELYTKARRAEAQPVHHAFEHEFVLMTALIFGYRALCLHLRGHLRAALDSFELCTSILATIGEQRAYAMFQRHLASLQSTLEYEKGVARALRLSVASAEATRQTDLAYLARVSQAQHAYPGADAATRRVLLRQLQTALLYAEAGDMHRVRVEAGLNLARIKQTGGDFDAALEHAADAMATATRYGLTLRKISLRILIGQILMNRGDPLSGKAILDTAIRNADRINYQRAVETAQNVLVKESSLSASSGNPGTTRP